MKVVGIGSKAGPEERSSIKGPVPCTALSLVSQVTERYSTILRIKTS